jgi:hypothetical protein
MSKVTAFAHPNDLLASVREERAIWTEGLHVCVTASLFRATKKREEFGRGATVTMLSLVGAFCGDWTSPQESLRQYAALTATLNALHVEGASVDAQAYRALRSGQRPVLAAIRELVQANVAPRALTPSPNDTMGALFRTVWERLEERHPAIPAFRQSLYGSCPLSLDELERRLLARHESGPERVAPERLRAALATRTLVVHPFVFITPLQYRVLEHLVTLGFELRFLVHHDRETRSLFAATESYFDGQLPLLPPPESADWERVAPHAETPPLPAGALALAHGLEDRRIAIEPDAAPVVETFEDIGALTRELRGDIEGGREIYAPNDSELRTILAAVVPEAFAAEQRSLLSYPVGTFLFHLHRLWSEEHRAMRIAPVPLYECFASGWLSTKLASGTTVNGRDVLKSLDLAMPLFEDCRTLREWNDRAATWEALHELEANTFAARLPAGASRFHHWLGRPLQRLSYLRVSSHDREAIVALVAKLDQLARQLFFDTTTPTEQTTTLAEHLRRLHDVLEDLGRNNPAIDAEGQRVAKALLDRLREGSADANDSFVVADLAEAIALVFGGELPSDDREDGIDDHAQARIVSMGQLDELLYGGAIARPDPASTEKPTPRPIHIASLVAGWFPTSQRAWPWPLSHERVAQIDAKHVGRNLLLTRDARTREANTYLFYLALAFGTTPRISTLRRLRGEAQVPSPLLLAVASPSLWTSDATSPTWPGVFPGLPEAERTLPSAPREARPSNAGTQARALSLEQITARVQAMPRDAIADFATCPRRFQLSFLCQDYPTFTSDFHHGFLFSAMARTFAERVRPKSPDEAIAESAKQVALYFPQWAEVRHRTWGDAVEPRTGENEYEGIRYPVARVRFQFFSTDLQSPGFSFMRPDPFRVTHETDYMRRVREAAEAATNEWKESTTELARTIDKSTDSSLPPTAKRGQCRLCPHNLVCRDAQFALDDDDAH